MPAKMPDQPLGRRSGRQNDGNRPRRPPVLSERGKSDKIRAASGFIWRIPVQMGNPGPGIPPGRVKSLHDARRQFDSLVVTGVQTNEQRDSFAIKFC
jgi:hypothetical protein